MDSHRQMFLRDLAQVQQSTQISLDLLTTLHSTILRVPESLPRSLAEQFLCAAVDAIIAPFAAVPVSNGVRRTADLLSTILAVSLKLDGMFSTKFIVFSVFAGSFAEALVDKICGASWTGVCALSLVTAIADADLPASISDRMASRASSAAQDRSLFAGSTTGSTSVAASVMHYALLAACRHRTNSWVRVARAVLAALQDGTAEAGGAYVMLDMELTQTPALVTRFLGTIRFSLALSHNLYVFYVRIADTKASGGSLTAADVCVLCMCAKTDHAVATAAFKILSSALQACYTHSPEQLLQLVSAAGRAEGMKGCADTVFDLCVALSQDGTPGAALAAPQLMAAVFASQPAESRDALLSWMLRGTADTDKRIASACVKALAAAVKLCPGEIAELSSALREWIAGVAGPDALAAAAGVLAPLAKMARGILVLLLCYCNLQVLTSICVGIVICSVAKVVGCARDGQSCGGSLWPSRYRFSGKRGRSSCGRACAIARIHSTSACPHACLPRGSSVVYFSVAIREYVVFSG